MTLRISYAEYHSICLTRQIQWRYNGVKHNFLSLSLSLSLSLYLSLPLSFFLSFFLSLSLPLSRSLSLSLLLSISLSFPLSLSPYYVPSYRRNTSVTYTDLKWPFRVTSDEQQYPGNQWLPMNACYRRNEQKAYLKLWLKKKYFMCILNVTSRLAIPYFPIDI